MADKVNELNMLISGMFKKDDRLCTCVYFSDGDRFAEGYVPGFKITSQKGFSEEEIKKLEEYLEANENEIVARAKQINPLKAMMKD